jgi:hypothetical protein
VPRREGDGRAGHDDVGAQAVDVERRAHSRDLTQRRVGQLHPRKSLASRRDALGELGVGVGPVPREALRVCVVREPAAHDLCPLDRVAGRRHLDRESEAVEQLRAQLPLLGVHRPDEQEARRVRDRDALALDVGAAHRRCVEEQVDEVVVEQVDLVDVEHSAVRSREQARLESLAALGPAPRSRSSEPRPGPRCARPADPQPRRARRAAAPGSCGPSGPARPAWDGAHADRQPRRASTGGQQGRERPYDGRLRGALLAAHEHPATAGETALTEQASLRSAGRRRR